MLQQLYLYQSPQMDPWHNLALEEYLLDHCPRQSLILYLWQNRRTVVIGRNQNPWKECRLEELQKDGGKLARRLSGGGAVFQDLGNLCFTFLTHKENYDVPRQMQVLIEACALLGIEAEVSGRNDAVIQGMKFSGNAFFERQGQCYHHGTILVSSDKEQIQAILQVHPQKLKAKGVDSVRSRVCNLIDFKPDITIEQVCEAMRQAFQTVYALPCSEYPLPAEAKEAIELGTKRFASEEWRFGETHPFNLSVTRRFHWGLITALCDIQDGRIHEIHFESDAMEFELFEPLCQVLLNQPFQRQALQPVIRSTLRPLLSPDLLKERTNDLCDLLFSEPDEQDSNA